MDQEKSSKKEKKEARNEGSSRRDFLKTSSLGAGIAFSSSHVAFSSARQPGGSSREEAPGNGLPDVVTENREFRLRISGGGRATSLLHKRSGQECLDPDSDTPMFTLTQYRPYENELQLRYPAKRKTFPARSVEQSGSQLLVRFELVDHEVTIDVEPTDEYISFKLSKIVSGVTPGLRYRRPTPADEVVFLQLPVKNRSNFGEWLNVMWDDEVAVNVLGTDPFPEIDSEERRGYRILRAGGVFEVKQEGVGAALIVTDSDSLLDRVAKVEEDFGLPRGVESRRRKEYPYSYYWASNITPQNVDEHIRWAREGGFQTFMIYYTAFAKSPGHYPFRDEYPGGMSDLQAVVGKIKNAGMIPGLHHHYNKAFGMDPYITPVPDARLNWVRSYTLAEDLDERATTVSVDENPRGSDLDSFVKYLRVGGELIEYEGYTTERPFVFTGCKRGAFETTISSHEKGAKLGLLGSASGVVGVYDQRTSIQEEVAARLGRLYQEAGFEFAYFDGAEDVPPPYWFTVSRAQFLTYEQMEPRPLFSEGACKSHFSWHILTRGNAFDIYEPEDMKVAIREHPSEEAPRMAKDFSGLNFGWIGYWAPGEDTIGTQPDMLEFATSRAAAWDCPISFRGMLDAFEAHPRTPDNFEVLRRWEEVRVRRWLTESHRQQLRNLDQEHILLGSNPGEFELCACEAIEQACAGDGRCRAFLLERGGHPWVVFWHTSGSAQLELPLTSELSVRQELDGSVEEPVKQANFTRLQLSDRRLIEFRENSREEVIEAFEAARIV